MMRPIVFAVLFTMLFTNTAVIANPLPGNADGSVGTYDGSGGTCDLEDFKKKLGYSESGGKYGIVNSLGYLGKYQFGESTLHDVGGYDDSEYSCSQCYQDFEGTFKFSQCGGVTTRAEYLACGPAQEDAFERLVSRNIKLTSGCHSYIGKQAPIGGCTVSLGGILGGAHIGGPTGVCKYLETNGSYNPSDGATRISDYVCKFADVVIPNDTTGCSQPGTPGEYGGSDAPAPIGGANAFPDTLTSEQMQQRTFEIQAQALKYIWIASFQRMTSQISTFMMQQVQIIGTFFDAKHQLETQRLMQEKAAQAHKDYQPSVQMCEIGTFVRSLMETEKRTEITESALSNAMIDRALSVKNSKNESIDSDEETKKRSYLETFCNQHDNRKENLELCENSGNAERQNADIDYTKTIDAPLTLNIDMTDGAASPEEENLFAFLDYIFMHDTFPWMSANETVLFDFIEPYQDMRSLIAMRSVAQNSFATIIAEKTQSSQKPNESVGPFLKALMREMGVAEDDIEKTIGENPSYYAQMEILTKRIYQHPEFVANLYDKPANVKRIRAALTAIKLMQERDIHNALLRREMLMSILLEIQLRHKQTNLIRTEIQPVLKDAPGEPIFISSTSSDSNTAESDYTPPQVVVMAGSDAVNDQIAQTIDELASTPEGQQILDKVAEKSPDGIIRFVAGLDQPSGAFIPNGFPTTVIGDGNTHYGTQYLSPESGAYHEITIQRLIIHEFYHFILGHEAHDNHDHESDEIDPDEIITTEYTNRYMKKYYGEYERDYYGDVCAPDHDVLPPCADPSSDSSSGYAVAEILTTPIEVPGPLFPFEPLEFN